MHFKVNSDVKLRVPKIPYYSGYAGNPIVKIPAGTIGKVHSVNVPSVRRDNVTFTVVTFKLPGIYSGNPVLKNDIWTCSCQNSELERINQ